MAMAAVYPAPGMYRVEVKRAAWDPKKHPRDRNGRFLHVGGVVTVHGSHATVIGNASGGRISVERSDGTHETVKADTVTAADDADHALAASVGKGAPAPLSDTEYEAHIKNVEAKVSQAVADGRETWRQHTLDPEGKVWTPERAQLHKEIVDEVYSTATGVPAEGKAVIAGGLGGAGKTTVLTKHAGIDTSQYLILNPDDVKGIMVARGLAPRIDGLSPMESGAALLHEESSHITDMIAARAYADKRNVMWDITMASPGSVSRRLDEMDAAGYSNVQAVFVDIPVETSVERAIARHRRGMEQWRAGEGYGGRYVPPSVIRSNADPQGKYLSRNRATFETLRKRTDSWQVYDNSVTGRAPQKIASGTNERGH